MPGDSRNKVKLNARVTPAKKQEWQNALEDGETLSSLVQRAVDREIRDEYVHVKTVEDLGGTDSVDIDTTGIENRIDDLQSTVSAVNRKIDTLAATEDAGQGEESIEDLSMNVLPRLPAYPSDIPDHILRDMDGMKHMEPKEYIEFIVESGIDPSTDVMIDGSAQRLSEEMREPEHKIRQALLYLERETTEAVHSALVDDTRHWMRV
ncbi:hypothetical protein JCM18237_16430 [Halorubrum luteum]